MFTFVSVWSAFIIIYICFCIFCFWLIFFKYIGLWVYFLTFLLLYFFSRLRHLLYLSRVIFRVSQGNHFVFLFCYLFIDHKQTLFLCSCVHLVGVYSLVFVFEKTGLYGQVSTKMVEEYFSVRHTKLTRKKLMDLIKYDGEKPKKTRLLA